MRIAAIFLLAALSCFASSGQLTEITGPTQITRKSEKIEGKVSVGVEMNDVIETLRGRAGITFEDNTKVQITEFSKLRIDEFVYDPASGKGKLNMKATSGTVRYASGLIAKNSRENIKVQTPTAVVSVRGTDFSMTVSEDGKSLIVLLPSIPLAAGIKPVVGSIEVENAAGKVVMTQPYQATFVNSSFNAPTAPVILNFQDESKINNMILLESPKSVTQGSKVTKKETKEKTDDGKKDDEPNKKKETKTEVAQVDKPSEAPAETVVAQNTQTETPTQVPETKLDINAIQPQVIQAAAEEAVAKSNQPATPAVTIAQPTATLTTNLAVSKGFKSNDGKTATLELRTEKSVIVYTARLSDNVSVNVNGEPYVLNFGEKSKVNITQK
jgi:outer membrane biosynthesis protein TonB